MPKIVLHKEIINLKNILTPISLGIITDIHLNRSIKSHQRFHEAIDLINSQNPDVILVLGDFLTDLYRNYAKLAPLKNLKAKYGVFAVLGNHDNGMTRKFMKEKPEKAAKIRAILHDLHISDLSGEKHHLKIGKTKLYLLGVEDYWSASFNMDIVEKLRTKKPVILLSHNPDAIMNIKEHQNVDLVVSGHTHGYALRLPKIGAVTTAGITKLGRKYDKGLKKYNGRYLYICSGVGGTTRTFNKPQVSLLHLQ